MIDSLSILRAHKERLRKRQTEKETAMRTAWNELFHEEKKDRKKSSTTKKVLTFVSNSGVIIDGVILGWKLYRRFDRKK